MAFYDFFARKDVSVVSRVISRRLHCKLGDLLRREIGSEKGSVLEIGSGMGVFAEIIKNALGMEYIGYEPNGKMSEHLRKRGFKIKEFCVPPLRERTESQEAIVLLQVIEHMPSVNEAVGVLTECFRVLKPGGVIFMTCPDFMEWGKDFYNLDYTHRFPTTELNVSQILQDVGFDRVGVYRYFGNLFGESGRPANFVFQSIRSIGSLLLPMSISRSPKFQKLGTLFAANILLIGRKNIQ